jgi:hypothetical protein
MSFKSHNASFTASGPTFLGTVEDILAAGFEQLDKQQSRSENKETSFQTFTVFQISWGLLHNWRSDIFLSNGFLLYKQLIRPMMDEGPAWKFAARTRVLRVLQSKCLHLTTGALW